MSTVGERRARLEAQINADLSAAPLPRAKLDLLWLGPEYLSLLQSLGGRMPHVVGVQNEAMEMLGRCASALQSGQISSDDLAWASRVDEIAGRAEAKARGGDYVGAIDVFRAGLREAPGCDNYMMSIAVCYMHLQMPNEALRYLERAHEVNPSNAKIARNLADLRSSLGSNAPAPEDDEDTEAEVDDGLIPFEHPEGLFSLRYADVWNPVPPISEGAALSCRTSDGDAIFEVMCFTRDAAGAGFVRFLADGMAKHGGGSVVHSRERTWNGADCAELVVKGREADGTDTLTYYVFLGAGEHAMYLALKTLPEFFEAYAFDFEEILGTLETPWFKASDPPDLWRPEAAPAYREPPTTAAADDPAPTEDGKSNAGRVAGFLLIAALVALTMWMSR